MGFSVFTHRTFRWRLRPISSSTLDENIMKKVQIYGRNLALPKTLEESKRPKRRNSHDSEIFVKRVRRIEVGDSW